MAVEENRTERDMREAERDMLAADRDRCQAELAWAVTVVMFCLTSLARNILWVVYLECCKDYQAIVPRLTLGHHAISIDTQHKG